MGCRGVGGLIGPIWIFASPKRRTAPPGLSEVSRDGAGFDADSRGIAGHHLRVAPAASLLDGGGGGAAADQLGGQTRRLTWLGDSGITRAVGAGAGKDTNPFRLLVTSNELARVRTQLRERRQLSRTKKT